MTSGYFNSSLLNETFNKSLWNTLYSNKYVIIHEQLDNYYNFLVPYITNSLIVVWSTLIIVFYYAFWGTQMISFSINTTDTFSDFFGTLSEIDDEIGSIDDIIHYFSIFILIVVWFFLFTVLFMFFFKTMSWTFTLIQFVLAVMLVLPFSIFYSYGSAFIVFLRGASRTSILSVEAGYDLLSVITMVTRYFVQHLRFVFIFLAFFDLFELVYTSLDFNGVNFVSQVFSFTSSTKNLFLTNYWYDWISDFATSHLIIFYYAAHLTYSLIIQLFNYLGLTVFIICFLYTGFISDTYEKYFANKR